MEKTHKTFKVGDFVEIRSRPKLWSSHFNQNNPFNLIPDDKYPVKGYITKIGYDDHWAIELVDCGWDLDCLIKQKLIKKVKCQVVFNFEN